MDKLAYWLNSCSFEEETYEMADEACRKLIVPYFDKPDYETVESLITDTVKLYDEVRYIRDFIMAEQLRINLVSRKEFVYNVMYAWQIKHNQYASIIAAICYDLGLPSGLEEL